MTVTQARIDTLTETVRARFIENEAVVAIADALSTAATNATDLLRSQRTVAEGSFAYPHNEIANLLTLAKAQTKVETLYDVLALALQRLGEKVER